jgi:hypothetical protein
VILLAVGWYLRFSLSYRDVEELLAERGLHTDHVTVWRWVQRYAPEMERRLRSKLKPTNDSWRVDETYIRVKGKWVYFVSRGGLHRCDRLEADRLIARRPTSDGPHRQYLAITEASTTATGQGLPAELGRTSYSRWSAYGRD